MICRINKMELVARLAARSVALDAELMSLVTAIVDDVRERGDEALIDYTARFDKVELKEIRVSNEELRRCAEGVDAQVRSALREAIENVRAFHERQVEESWTINPREGVQLGQRITPLVKPTQISRQRSTSTACSARSRSPSFSASRKLR